MFLIFYCLRQPILFHLMLIGAITGAYHIRQRALVEITAICRKPVYEYSRMILLERVTYCSQAKAFAKLCRRGIENDIWGYLWVVKSSFISKSPGYPR